MASKRKEKKRKRKKEREKERKREREKTLTERSGAARRGGAVFVGTYHVPREGKGREGKVVPGP